MNGVVKKYDHGDRTVCCLCMQELPIDTKKQFTTGTSFVLPAFYEGLFCISLDLL